MFVLEGVILRLVPPIAPGGHRWGMRGIPTAVLQGVV